MFSEGAVRKRLFHATAREIRIVAIGRPRLRSTVPAPRATGHTRRLRRSRFSGASTTSPLTQAAHHTADVNNAPGYNT